VAAYRLEVDVADRSTVTIHVSADQRYELWLDGHLVGRGPERGDQLNWFFETYELCLEPGAHALVARVWTLELLPGLAPAAQVAVRHGFLLAAEAPFGDLFSTGVATWDACTVTGYAFRTMPPHGAGHLAGGTVQIDAKKYPWGIEHGKSSRFTPAKVVERAAEWVGNNAWGELLGHRLTPAVLPAMLDRIVSGIRVRHADAPESSDTENTLVEATACLDAEVRSLQAVLDAEQPLLIEANARRRFILDLGDYYCAYPELTVSGGDGARVRLQWAESLYLPTASGGAGESQKGQRDSVDGKRFLGRGDELLPDGGEARTLRTLWWCAGRYLELLVETGPQPIRIDRLVLRETRYPLELAAPLEIADDRFEGTRAILWRTLEVCSHETYMDCPYYEQLQYTGDTRVEALVTLACSGDDRLPKKAVRLYGASLLGNGLTQSRYPASQRQVIPQFSLFWVAMVYDYALWRGDRSFLRPLLPKVRVVLDTFLTQIDSSGLLRVPEGWSWCDWVEGWPVGTPPADAEGRSAINALQLVMVLGHAVKLERWIGEPELAQRWERHRRELMARINDVFWSASRGLYADTVDHSTFSEHAQCYAVLTGLLEAERRDAIARGLRTEPLTRATFYFEHYLFETYRSLGMVDLMLERYGEFYKFQELGLATALEKPDPSRSDCHAWASHPLLHVLTSILGIRPHGFGFERVHICPNLAGLREARGAVPHPKGLIRVELRQNGARVAGTIELPPDLTGLLVANGEERILSPGTTSL
jgi:hypothetical protein